MLVGGGYSTGQTETIKPRSHFYKISSFPRLPPSPHSWKIGPSRPTGPLFHQNRFGRRDGWPQSASGGAARRETYFVPNLAIPTTDDVNLPSSSPPPFRAPTLPCSEPPPLLDARRRRRRHPQLRFQLVERNAMPRELLLLLRGRLPSLPLSLFCARILDEFNHRHRAERSRVSLAHGAKPPWKSGCSCCC